MTDQRLRPALACLVGVVAALQSWAFWSDPALRPSDFAQLWAAAGGWLNGKNPYEVVGPGRSFDWQFPLLYPFTAVLTSIPFVPLPLRFADAAFAAIGAGTFAYAVTQQSIRTPALAAFLSTAMLSAIQSSQWSPLLTAAALVPSLGFLLAAKPTLGIALLLAFPTKRAIAGAIGFTLLATLIFPGWISEWRQGLSTATHIVAPVTRWGGPLILLALLRWRRSEARLVAALACVPQTLFPYELVPLFLVPATWREGLILGGASILAFLAHRAGEPYANYEAWVLASANWHVWLVYLPAVAMVLRRPNVSSQRANVELRPPGETEQSLPPDETAEKGV